MPLGVSPQKYKLKTRFPLYEMIIDDDDFQVRLKDRRKDVSCLKEQLSNNTYCPYEAEMNLEQ